MTALIASTVDGITANSAPDQACKSTYGDSIGEATVRWIFLPLNVNTRKNKPIGRLLAKGCR